MFEGTARSPSTSFGRKNNQHFPGTIHCWTKRTAAQQTKAAAKPCPGKPDSQVGSCF